MSPDFQLFDESGARPGTSLSIGMGFVRARDAVARGLVRIGITPNHVTLLGLAANIGAAVTLVFGAGHGLPFLAKQMPIAHSWWPLLAAVWLLPAGACDMLDGAVARVGGLATPFGGMLDSVVDRISDMVLYGGILVHFAVVGNVTYVVLAFFAVCNTVLISYSKARAETCVNHAGVGFWQRGERSAAMLLAALSGHVPALLWQQAILPFLTFLRRMIYARAAVRAQAAGRPAPSILPPKHGWGRLCFWRYPRGSVPYDITVFLNAAFLVVGPCLVPVLYDTGDPLGAWLRPLIKGLTNAAA